MSEFNFKSAICTSRTQSERLLALGLKKETADMVYLGTSEYYGGVLTEGISSHPMIIDTEDYEVTEYDIPARSLHRLLSVIPEYVTPQGYQLQTVGRNVIGYSYPIGVVTEEEWWYKLFNKVSLYDSLCDCIEWLIKEGYFNKEYLNK